MTDSSGVPNPLACVMTRYRAESPKPAMRKPPGRPQKRTSAYFRSLLEQHRFLVAWFEREFGCSPASDRQLYTEHFAREFAARGERPGRASSQQFQSKLKTLRNELAEARRMERANPENAAIAGTPTSVQ